MKVQRPQNEQDWLYKDVNDDRWFTKEVVLNDNAEPWAECTNEEKEQWEHDHPQPEPVETTE